MLLLCGFLVLVFLSFCVIDLHIVLQILYHIRLNLRVISAPLRGNAVELLELLFHVSIRLFQIFKCFVGLLWPVFSYWEPLPRVGGYVKFFLQFMQRGISPLFSFPVERYPIPISFSWFQRSSQYLESLVLVCEIFLGTNFLGRFSWFYQGEQVRVIYEYECYYGDIYQ